MKTKKLTQILGSAVLIASIGLTGCGMNATVETSEETTTKETTEATTTTTEDPCACVVEEDDDEQYYSCPAFNSTNGELEGQMDYMVPVPPMEEMDFSNYPDDDSDLTITDVSVIEDEDIRAIAQEYMDEGYSINDPNLDQQYGFAFGDGEYMFADGFTAFRNDNGHWSYVSLYKMNETLFEHYFVETQCYEGATTEDDGTVIRYGVESAYVEFNRDTGIGYAYSSWDE